VVTGNSRDPPRIGTVAECNARRIFNFRLSRPSLMAAKGEAAAKEA
jgi:hypothetical protein